MEEKSIALTWPQKIVRRCPRILCVQVLFVLLVSTVWWTNQALPVLLSEKEQPDLFYGMPHFASQSPLFGKVTLRINNDDEARFLFWMDETQRQVFDLLVYPGVSVEIVGLRSFGNDWIVIAFSTNQGGLDIEALQRQREKMAKWTLVFALLSLLLLLVVLRFYLRHYRGRRWL